jgi:hypothetical protein
LLISLIVSVRIFVMDAQISSLIEQYSETQKNAVEKGNEAPQNTPTPEKETDATGDAVVENGSLPPAPPIEDKRKEVTPTHTVVAGDSITSLADRLEGTAIDEFQKNNLPNGSA